MAITTYSEMKTAVANWLHRSDLTSRVPEFIALAEDRIGLALRVRAMETTGDLTISSQTTALPTGFVAARRLYLGTAPVRLDFYPPEEFWLLGAADDTGRPRMFTIEGDSIAVAPSPDASYTGKLLYYKKFTALSADADTNWILSNARGLYLYGALLEAAPFIKDDPRLPLWGQMYEAILEACQAADRRDRYPPGFGTRSDVPAI